MWPQPIFLLVVVFAGLGSAIKCFVGNEIKPTKKSLVDCGTLGIQREELYCRNITVFFQAEPPTVKRSCVAMSWFDATWEAMGCHESVNGDTKLIRCTCEKDLCNAPVTDPSEFHVSSSRNLSPIFYLAFLPIFYNTFPFHLIDRHMQ